MEKIIVYVDDAAGRSSWALPSALLSMGALMMLANEFAD
jgi:hypothetical protein